MNTKFRSYMWRKGHTVGGVVSLVVLVCRCGRG